MNLIQITPGAGGMYCGNCFRDNTLVAELRRQGHDTLLVPLYLPLTLDEAPTHAGSPTFFGGINVYLSQKSRLHQRAPRWFRRFFDSPKLLKWAAGKAAKTKAEEVGELTVSMLRGEEGHQNRELSELIDWLKTRPKPDAIFLSNALLVGFARRLKAELGTRVICFLQSEESFLDSLPESERGEAWTVLSERAEDVDGWIAPTEYFGSRMSERLALPSAKVHVVPNGISLQGYDQLPPRSTAADGALTWGFFARQCPEKGLDLVIDAYLELRRRGKIPGLRLRVGGGCGPGDLQFVNAQKSKLADAGLSEEVSFHPNLSRNDKIAFLVGCDVLSVPARISEAFGLYLLEAWAAGTPVVQPDVCGFRELIEITGGGELYSKNNAASLAQAMEALLLEPTRLRDLGASGRRAVTQYFSDSVMAREILAATGRILAGLPPNLKERNRLRTP